MQSTATLSDRLLSSCASRCTSFISVFIARLTVVATRSSHTLTCAYVVAFICPTTSGDRRQVYHEVFSFCQRQQAPPTFSALPHAVLLRLEIRCWATSNSPISTSEPQRPLDLVLATSPQPSFISSIGRFSLQYVTARSRMCMAGLTRYSSMPPGSILPRVPDNIMDGSARYIRPPADVLL